MAQVQHLLHAHKGPADFFRGAGEGAVVADVAAQVGEWDKYLARVGHHVVETTIPQFARHGRQRRRVGERRQGQCLFRTEALPRQQIRLQRLPMQH